MTDKERNILNQIEELIQFGQLSNDFLVENIKLSGQYLNIETPSNYAKQSKMTYAGARKDYKGRKNIKLFGARFIIDNY